MPKQYLLINFFNEDVAFLLKHKRLIKNWIEHCVKQKKKKTGAINFIFCSDPYLLSINKTYLNHNTLTDIITFDYTSKNVISGDIFISIDRVIENAKYLKITNKDEVHRVMIHGILHLCGFKDKSAEDKLLMRKQEDKCLSLRTF